MNQKIIQNFSKNLNGLAIVVRMRKKGSIWSLFRIGSRLNSIPKHFLFEFASLLRFQ